MALKWVEGFESYNGLVSFLQHRYATVIGSSLAFVPGRAIGQALQMNGSEVTTPAFSNHATWTVGLAFKNNNLSTSNTFMPVIEVRDGTTSQITASFNPSTKVWRISRGTTVLATGTFVLTTGYWYYVELQVLCDTVSGTVELKVNTVSDATFSGNTAPSGNNYANKIALKGPTATGIGGNYYVDDYYINDGSGVVNNDFLGDMKVEAVNVIESGNSAQWGVNILNTPNFQAVQVLNDGLYIQSNIASDVDTYTTSNLNKITSNIAGVQVINWSRNTDSTTHAIRSVARISSTDYESTDITINDTAFKAFQYIWETNPDSTIAWTVGDIGTTEFGVKLQS
jgi:hypothetical protein